MLAVDLKNLKHANLRIVCRMIIYRFKKKNELRMWDMYISKYQHMDKKSYLTFDEFYNAKEDINIEESNKKTDEEIVDEVMKIRKKLGKVK